VEQALRSKFGDALKPGGEKAFHVVTGPGQMTADVLAAVMFKKYTYFQSPNNETFDEGVEFADTTGTLTVNYPKLHIKNGEDKNLDARTKGWYKPSVRMFKNARNTIRQLPDGCAPSYFVECLLYNVPDGNFGGTFQQTYYNVVKHLHDNPIGNFRCQNGQISLFGTTSIQWNTTDASIFQRLAIFSPWLHFYCLCQRHRQICFFSAGLIAPSLTGFISASRKGRMAFLVRWSP
jgi:hypothetical protein